MLHSLEISSDAMDKDNSVIRKGKQRYEIGISNITSTDNINKNKDTGQQ